MLSQFELKKQVHYNPDTGVFRSRIAKPGWYAWVVLGSIDTNGYRVIVLDGKPYGAHRLAILYVDGFLPDYVDHKDRVRDNNKYNNLRVANHSINMRNRPTNSNNSSGIKGVCFDKQTGKWLAHIWLGRSVKLGRHTNKDDAVMARYKAELEHPDYLVGSPAKKYLEDRDLL